MIAFILNRGHLQRRRVIFRDTTVATPPHAYRRTPEQVLGNCIMSAVDAATPGGVHQWHPRRRGWASVYDYALAMSSTLLLAYLAFRI